MSRDGLKQKHEAKKELKIHHKRAVSGDWSSITAASSLSQMEAVVREDKEKNCVTQEY